MIRVTGQGVLSAYFPITQNQEWLIHQRVVLPYRNFNKLEKWVNRNFMKFNKKCKVFHLGRNNPRSEHFLGSTQLESKFECGHEVEYEPTVCSGCKEGKWYPRLHYTRYCHQAERADPYPLSNTDESTLGVLYPALGSSV